MMRLLQQPAEKRAVIRLTSQVMDQLHSARRNELQKMYQEKLLLKIQQIIQAGVEKGELRSVSPGVAAWAMLGMLYPYYYPVHAREIPSSDQILEQLLTIYFQGMSSEP